MERWILTFLFFVFPLAACTWDNVQEHYATSTRAFTSVRSVQAQPLDSWRIHVYRPVILAPHDPPDRARYQIDYHPHPHHYVPCYDYRVRYRSISPRSFQCIQKSGLTREHSRTYNVFYIPGHNNAHFTVTRYNHGRYLRAHFSCKYKSGRKASISVKDVLHVDDWIHFCCRGSREHFMSIVKDIVEKCVQKYG